jgi:hypothetical protein
MPATLLLVTEVFSEPTAIEQSIDLWQKHNTLDPDRESMLYRSTEDSSLLELTPLTDPAEIGKLQNRWRDLSTTLAPSLIGDFRRQVLEFVEGPKWTEALLPCTPYIQLRHVEVRPSAYNAYRSWRDRTIFEVVRRSPEVAVFLAYHSLLSTEPGVMFVSGFSCKPEQYSKVFSSPEYQEIVRQAGATYITGGERGLYTKIYARIET